VTGTVAVQVAYLHREEVSHSWAHSMRAMLDHDLAQAVADGAPDLAGCIEHGYRIARRPLNMRCGAGMVAHTRNYAARLFLDKTPHEWLLFVDTDMGFESDAVHRLLEVADPATRPVVGALCFALMESQYDGMGGYRRTVVPTMYSLGTSKTGQPSFCYFGDYPVDEVTPVAATGGAFLLIHRGALEKLRAEHGDHWFDMIYDADGDIVGEDIAFCGRLLKAGIIPVVHTGVKTSHHKAIWLSEPDYVAQGLASVSLPTDTPVYIDLDASFAALAGNEHDRDGMLKFPADLDRYAAIIDATRPEVIVETGTRTGGSARWFAEQGPDVITVDVNPVEFGEATERGRRIGIVGNSADPAVAARVAELVAGRRCMVSLDSDHSGPHVAAEIDLYGPLVSPGCYLVVEDGIFGYAPPALRAQHGLAGMVGSPLDAIADKLLDTDGWSRDVAIERAAPVSSNPAGWWVKTG
jgi:cephalosporin hydroxylase